MDAVMEHLGVEAPGKDKESTDSELIPIEVTRPEDRPVNPIPGADALRKSLLDSKSFIAKSGDAAAKKRWNDIGRSRPPKHSKTAIHGYDMPLTEKGHKVLGEMERTYGSKEKGEQVPYATKNAGTITGVDEVTRWHRENVIWASGEHEPDVKPDQSISGTQRVQSWEP